MKNIQYLLLLVAFAFTSCQGELLPSKSKNVLREYVMVDSEGNHIDVIIFEDDGKKFMLTRGYSSMGLVQIEE